MGDFRKSIISNFGSILNQSPKNPENPCSPIQSVVDGHTNVSNVVFECCILAVNMRSVFVINF